MAGSRNPEILAQGPAFWGLLMLSFEAKRVQWFGLFVGLLVGFAFLFFWDDFCFGD